MFNRDEKKLRTTAKKARHDLISVESVERLLDDKKRQTLVQQIAATIGLDSAHFHKLGLSLVQNVTRYCQNLPETTLYYAHRGGLLDRALNRTEAALQLIQPLIILDKHSAPSEEQKLWLYALFSASMLQGIGKLYTDYQIDLFDSNGQLIQRWHPLQEDLSTVGKYYYYDFLRGDDLSFRNNITPLLARQLMPNAGFSWIMSNPEVFAVWLALLQEDRDSAGPLAAILDRADAIAIQRDMNEYLLKNAELDSRRRGTFVDSTPETLITRERVIGAEFITWLTQGLETGKIIINKIPMLMEVLPTGIVMSPQLFDMFAQEHRKFKNKVAIQQAFLAWNVHRLTDAAKETFNSLGKDDKKHAVSAIAIDTAILPQTVKVYNEKTGKISTISSLDLVHNMQQHQFTPNELGATLNHLSAAGKWVAAEEHGVEHRYGNNQRV